MQQAAALVVQAAPAHVDGLDLGGGLGLDRLVIALADQEIVLHDAAERRQRQHDVLERLARSSSATVNTRRLSASDRCSV